MTSEQEVLKLRKALAAIVNAEALAGVRDLVAGWNGENREDGPYRRHPPKLGATLPKTTCSAIYALDEALQQGRSVIASESAPIERSDDPLRKTQRTRNLQRFGSANRETGLG